MALLSTVASGMLRWCWVAFVRDSKFGMDDDDGVLDSRRDSSGIECSKRNLIIQLSIRCVFESKLLRQASWKADRRLICLQVNDPYNTRYVDLWAVRTYDAI